MKQLLFILSVGLIFMLLLSVGLLAGCTTTRTPSNFATLKSVQQSIDSAMDGYVVSVDIGNVTLTQQAVIESKHNEYLAAFRLAARNTRYNLSAAPPVALKFLADDLLILVTQSMP